MATVLITWELGRGMGHMTQLLPIGKGLVDAGHRVFAAIKDVSRAEDVFAGSGIQFLQCPTYVPPPHLRIEPAITYAHILHNMGFAARSELSPTATAWRTLYDLVQPELVLFDYSPTALFAFADRPARRAVIGTGFFTPLDQSPLPDLRPWHRTDPAKLAQDEARVLQAMNEVRQSWELPPLERVSQLNTLVDETFFTTFAELDHYPNRTGAKYWGVWPHGQGVPFQWPFGKGPRIYAYFKSFPALPAVLKFFQQTGWPTIVVTDGIDRRACAEFATPSLRFEDRPLDMTQVAAECDLAILNANHGTLAALLLAGKPSLQIPNTMERDMLAQRFVELGAGLSAHSQDGPGIVTAIQRMVQSPQYAEAAGRFAARYADYQPQKQIDLIVERLQQLIARKAGS